VIESIGIGDIVQWKCSPYFGKPFIAQGIVQKIAVSTFGAKKRGMSVKVAPMGEYCRVFPMRSTTTISADNIITREKQ